MTPSLQRRFAEEGTGSAEARATGLRSGHGSTATWLATIASVSGESCAAPPHTNLSWLAAASLGACVRCLHHSTPSTIFTHNFPQLLSRGLLCDAKAETHDIPFGSPLPHRRRHFFGLPLAVGASCKSLSDSDECSPPPPVLRR